MKYDRQKIIKFFQLPLWLVILMVIVSASALVFVFVNDMDSHPIAYFVYVLSFYTLIVMVFDFVCVLPSHYRKVKRVIYDNKYSGRYMTDVAFKNHVLLYCSLTVNLLYVAVNLISGIIYNSIWFMILAGYYVILSVMRFLLVRYYRSNTIGQSRVAELKRSRLCAIILLFVNIYLSCGVLMMLYQNKGFEYNGILIYIMAVYTFYVTISAIRNCIKYKKYQSPVMSTSKVISLAAALVSMLSLETAMLAQFGSDMNEFSRKLFIALTGAGISVIVIAMSVYMIARASSEIKEVEESE